MEVDLSVEEIQYMIQALYEYDDLLHARDDDEGLEICGELYERLSGLVDEEE
jgi:hypothetical protein